jgi:murein DD-endopeptidase MepM/ murein hydrolase activator NlpD
VRTPASQDAQARRALIEDIKQDRKGWLQHGLAALGVSLLGLGVAGSVVLTSNAEHVQAAVPTAQLATNPQSATAPEITVPPAFDRAASSISRDLTRPALDPAKLKSLADQRAEELSKTDDQIAQAARTRAATAREKSLERASRATQKQGARLAREAIERKAAKSARAAAARAAARDTARSASRRASAATTRPAPATRSSASPSSGGRSCMPVRGGYSIAAHFGQVGAWSRYHTGFDFSAPVGTTLQAPAAGVVTNAGGGPASGWAGNYVTIRYPDGTQSLMAHMSTVSVRVGQSVSACETVGAVGMTGRTFGPHVHFEIYPAGVTPGDVYRAVNPVSWLNGRGLRP